MANAVFGFEKVQGSTFTNTLVDDAILYFDGDTQSIHFGSRQTDPIPSMFSVTRSNGELGTRFHLPIDVESDATFRGNIYTSSNLEVGGSVRAGTMLPRSNEEFDLGSFEARWRDLYLSGNTIYLGDTRLHTELDTQNLRISDNSNKLRSITAAAVQIGDPQIDAETGKTIKSVIRLNETGRVQIQTLSGDSNDIFNVDSNITTNFNVDGSVTTENTLSVGGDATFSSNVSIDGDIGVGTSNPTEKLHVEGNIYTSSNLEVGGSVRAGSIIPLSNEEFDLGSFDARWRDLYLSGNTIYLGDTRLQTDPGTQNLRISDNSNNLHTITAAAVQIGDPQIDAETRKIIKSVIRLDETGRVQIQKLSGDSNNVFIVDSNMTTNFNVDGSITTENTLIVGGDAVFSSNVSVDGDIGIGTSNPTEKLHVEGNIYTSSNLTVGGNTQIDGDLTVSGISMTLDTDVNMSGRFSLSNGALDINSIGDIPSLFVTQNGAGDVAHFSQNEARILSIVNGGNVGIGTDVPTEKLHVAGNIMVESNIDILGKMSMIGKVDVNDTDIKFHLPVEMGSNALFRGDARIQGNLKVNGTMTTINTNVKVTDQFSIVNDGTDVAFSVNQIGPRQIAKFMDDGVPVVSIMDGGLVGMGTDTPEARLHVVGKIYTTSNLEVGGNAQVDGNIVTSSKLTVNDDATFKNNVLIQKDTGIGTSTPSEKLHVVGNIYTTGSIKVDGNTQVDGNLATSSELTVGDDATFDSNVLVTGNIGINTDSPGEKLHVVGNALITGNIEATNAQLGGNLTVNGDTVTLNSDLQITGQFTLPEGSVSITNTGSGPALMVKQSVDEPVVQLFNGDNNIVTVSSNVGIGTNTPLEKLHVAGKILGTGDMNVKGSVVVDQNLTVGGTIFTNGGITITSGSDAEDNTIQQPVNDVTIDGNLLVNGDVRVTTGTSVRLEQDVFMTGNLGLGTDNPQERLHVVGDALISGNVRATDAQVTGNLTVDGDSVTLNAGVDINGEFSLSNGSLSIYNSGTVPALSVNQEGTEDIAHFEQNGVSVLRIIDGGNVGIGTTTPTERLQVIGSILASQEFIAESDRRVKDNIKLIENGLDKVEQMNGYTFTKMEVDENVNVPKKRMGVIAQELLEIIPEVVHYDKDADRYSVAYGNIVGVLIEGIKDLSKEVKSLSKRVERVERVESLEGL